MLGPRQSRDPSLVCVVEYKPGESWRLGAHHGITRAFILLMPMMVNLLSFLHMAVLCVSLHLLHTIFAAPHKCWILSVVAPFFAAYTVSLFT